MLVSLNARENSVHVSAASHQRAIENGHQRAQLGCAQLRRNVSKVQIPLVLQFIHILRHAEGRVIKANGVPFPIQFNHVLRCVNVLPAQGLLFLLHMLPS